MIFSSLTFVVFFGIVFTLFKTLPTDKARLWMLLVANYIFYGWWDWHYTFLMFGSSAWSWWFAGLIAKTDDVRKRRLLLLVALVGDLGVLGYFKYTNFLVDSVVGLFGGSVRTFDIVLPVGISFFTFQSMSYTLDIYRRELEPQPSLMKYLLFVSFFTHLVAGPIVRASLLVPQFDRPAVTNRAFIVRGLQVFVLGLFQKIVVADNLSQFVDPVFKAPGAYDALTLWAAMLAYALQIFCDFSGYSLMAIGAAKVLGYDLCVNFRTPYISRSITEFWRRWHISLSTWLRDYLYISLGGNRKGKLRTDVNLVLTMLLGGLWHGAGWNFVIWGGAHGVGLLVHKHWSRLRGDAKPSAAGNLAAWALTLLFVLLLWIPFRCRTFDLTLTYLHGLFVDSGGIRWLHTHSLVLIGLMAAWHVLHVIPNRVLTALPSERPLDYAPLASVGLLLLAVLLFAPWEASPFIYFQF